MTDGEKLRKRTGKGRGEKRERQRKVGGLRAKREKLRLKIFEGKGRTAIEVFLMGKKAGRVERGKSWE